MTPEAEQFLRTHEQGILATGRRDGSPQASTVVYDFNGTDIVISTKAFTAKWKNVLRQPRVCLIVNDEHAQAIVYEAADGVDDDPERLGLTKRMAVFQQMLAGQDMEDSQFSQLLDAQERTVIRITPDKVLFNE